MSRLTSHLPARARPLFLGCVRTLSRRVLCSATLFVAALLGATACANQPKDSAEREQVRASSAALRQLRQQDRGPTHRGRTTVPRTALEFLELTGPDGPAGTGAQAIRSRRVQFSYCYTERGLRPDRSLRGEVTLLVRLDSGGRAANIEVSERTWSGSAAAAAEECMMQKIRRWALVGSAPGTYRIRLRFRPEGVRFGEGAD